MLSNIQSMCIILPLLSGLAHAGLVPQKRADICGQKGYDRGKGNYDYDSSGKYSTYAKCSARCVADTKCKSFGFGGNECLLFNVAVSGNFDADSGSSDTYYDRGCVSSSPAPASTSTTTSSSKTSSSTSKPTSSSTSKPTTSSTTKPASSTSLSTSTVKPSTTPATTPSATSSTAPGVTVPAGCNVPTKFTMTSLNWFNSTHNLDCANPNYPSDARVCWNSASNTVCADGDPSCTCTPYCYTGLPSAAYQPLGFGPPDTISIGFANGASCSAANGQSIRRYEIGEGHFACGSAADYIGFYGNSNKDTGNTGSVYYNNYANTCNGGVPRYEGTFPLICTHDAGNNATCTAPVPVELTLVSL
ncbi:hypothetical protein J7T55_004988 [Diaporthe amygdali]|uniref:uncharacterized protein n=1 Tax=Phomopsis amygdali TaxID=1214568 RepID=UPI0022FE9AF2|nr:uncharacterized protein J7T55_004988 [Diaporthe amygdali]KAJ0116043.1 hypothetical protein J7T55_004988 [Diaporthe amygdali]